MKILIIVFYHAHLILHTKSLSKTSEQMKKKKKRETERETEMEEEIIMTILSASSLKETYG